jgi:adenine/guanine phosphoribosyltransferase-like PRPP-binding protein
MAAAGQLACVVAIGKAVWTLKPARHAHRQQSSQDAAGIGLANAAVTSASSDAIAAEAHALPDSVVCVAAGGAHYAVVTASGAPVSRLDMACNQ